MSVRLNEDEVLAFLADSHTGILATLRSDGSPAVTPLWFVLVERHVCLRTLGTSAKVKHVRRDPRVSFVVESGRAWAELAAVVLSGDAEFVDDPDSIAAIDEAFALKYDAYRMPSTTPARTREHYQADRARLRIVPTRTALTWNNAKLLR